MQCGRSVVAAASAWNWFQNRLRGFRLQAEVPVAQVIFRLKPEATNEF
jgi:hypothetical protein